MSFYEKNWIKQYKITPRELDVLACLLEHTQTKKVASVLNITPRAVDTHIFNIQRKLEKNSRVAIVDFIKDSSQIKELKLHSHHLIRKYKFKEILQHLKKTIRWENISCQIICQDKEVERKLQIQLKELGTSSTKDNQILINADHNKDYYVVFFEVLQKLIKHPLIEEAISYFSEKHEHNTIKQLIRYKEQNKLKQGFIVPVIIIGLIFGFFYHKKYKVLKYPHTVLSELKIPHESVLLKRPHLMSSLTKRLKDNNDIAVMAIAGVVGVGGVGKTTLARMWGKKYQNQYPKTGVFEINAETKKSVAKSFEEISILLAQSAQEKEELLVIERMTNAEQRKKAILVFVQKKLKAIKKWLLIFDNVENLAMIKEYLPQNKSVWGSGCILITTRNSHIQYADFINTQNILSIDTLNNQEALDLFSHICFQKDSKKLSKKEYDKAMDFLKHVPAFPLDISIAARYITNYKVSYEEYLKKIHQNDSTFHESQSHLIKATSYYTHTRYNIIKLALDQVVQKDSRYLDLLVLMSYVDSQAIPQKLLQYCRPDIDIESFLHEMKKHSLITIDKDSNIISAISLHRSTQDMCRLYLLKNLPIKAFNRSLQNVENALVEYVYIIRNSYHHIRLHNIVIHLKKIVKHQETKYLYSSIKALCACALYEMGYDKKAMIVLHKYLQYPHKNNKLLTLALSTINAYDLRHGKFSLAESNAKKLLLIYQQSKQVKAYNHALVSLGFLNMLMEKYDKADKIFQNLIKRIPEKDEIDENILVAMGYQIRLNLDRGFYSKASETFQKGLSKINSDTLRAWYLGQASHLYKKEGNYEKSYKMLNYSINTYQTHQIKAKALGWFFSSLGSLYQITGQYKKANDIFIKASEIYESDNDLENINYLFLQGQKSKLYVKQGLYSEALEVLKSLKEKYQKLYGQQSFRTNWINYNLGLLYIDLGKYSEAKQLLEDNLKYYQKVLPKTHPKIGNTFTALGKICLKMHEIDKAFSLLTQGLKILENHYGKDHLQTAESYRLLGELHIQKNTLEKAELFLQKSLSILKKYNHPDMSLTFENLAKLSLIKNKQNKTKWYKKQNYNYLKKALKIERYNFPKESQHIARIQESISALT